MGAQPKCYNCGCLTYEITTFKEENGEGRHVCCAECGALFFTSFVYYEGYNTRVDQ